MVANRQITHDYFVRQDNSQEWKPIANLCQLPAPLPTPQTTYVPPNYTPPLAETTKHRQALEQVLPKKVHKSKQKRNLGKGLFVTGIILASLVVLILLIFGSGAFPFPRHVWTVLGFISVIFVIVGNIFRTSDKD